MFDFTNYNQLSRIVINKVELKFANKKLGGKLKQVSEKQWEERFGTEDFLKGHKKEYEFSFSKKNEILYGIVSIEVPGYGTKKFRVHNREMLEGQYEKLKKSLIGGTEIAACRLTGGDGDGSFAAIVEGSQAVYSLETYTNEIKTKEQFISLLKLIFEKQEDN